jgi:hypothetical protein
MMFGDRLDQLRRVSLPAVLRETGAQRDRYDRAKWHTPKGAISVTGMKFMNWHQSLGGGGAIDLAMHLNGLDFKSAVAWLQRHFSTPPDSASPPAPPRLILPPPDRSQLSAVKHYLVHDRSITPSLTDSLIACEKLYADRRGNAVFLLLGKKNTPVAELRHRTATLARHGARFPKRSRLLLGPGSGRDDGDPVRVRHRRHQLLSAPFSLSVPIHIRSSAQSALASYIVIPRPCRLLRF